MTTKGAWGFIINKKEKIIFCQADSYPSHLGVEVLQIIYRYNLEQLECIAKRIRNTNNKLKEVISLPYEIYNDNVKNLKTTIWISNQSRILHDSLFCQYAYIINIDTQMIEVYTGFNQNPKAYGRYASKNTFTREQPDNFYGVVLRREIPFKSIWQNKENFESLWQNTEIMYDISSLMEFFEGID